MTDKQKELLHEMFNGGYSFGSWPPRAGDMKVFHIQGYFWPPQSIDKLQNIADNDKKAADVIAECQKAIETLTAYRIALAERYNELATAPTVPVIKLIREKRYQHNVKYYIRFCSRNLDTGKDIETDVKVYEGSERHQAIKDFESYVKDHPGIIAEKSIEKSKWER